MLSDLPSPCLLLDEAKLDANLARLARRIAGLHGVLRPHVKTHKSVDIWRKVEAAGSTRGVTVSTLREAEHFFAAGCDDILYAVGVTPSKLDQAAALMNAGCRLQLILDSAEMATLVAQEGDRRGLAFPLLIELDVDGHRSGVDPDGEELLAIARLLHASPGAELQGVMTHAGASYDCRSADALAAMARKERDRAVGAAERVRREGLPAPVVSVGSTPTAFAIDDLTGVTEVRAGVYMFFDLVMAGIGACAMDDIALSVLATVIGHQTQKGWILTDAGWMAMSRDRGTASQAVDQFYGVVCDLA
ncbi:MAG: alanine racemase, partial [Caulobacterales bacterium]|nr:alanine racemase [Caulobacterales bacterium]